jgi:hypothetical protein
MPDANDSPAPDKGQFLLYQTEDGKLKIDVRFEGETVWLTQQHMAELFQTTQQNISLHLQNIYEEGELTLAATHKEFLSVRREGSRDVQRQLDFYNLDAIISVGYRVKSRVATQFRIWATQRLREYIVKGFVLDDERLKNPDRPFDYFDELLRRIQDIRTSERRFYQKITDIYATSLDYDPTRPESIEFFQTVQNKMHWAITGQTAAEIIHTRAASARPHMGLTTWRGAKVRKVSASRSTTTTSTECAAPMGKRSSQATRRPSSICAAREANAAERSTGNNGSASGGFRAGSRESITCSRRVRKACPPPRSLIWERSPRRSSTPSERPCLAWRVPSMRCSMVSRETRLMTVTLRD